MILFVHGAVFMNVTSQMSFNQAKGSIIAIVEFIHTDDKTKSVSCSTYPLVFSSFQACFVRQHIVSTQSASNQRVLSLIPNILNSVASNLLASLRAFKAVCSVGGFNAKVLKGIALFKYLDAVASFSAFLPSNKRAKEALAD